MRVVESVSSSRRRDWNGYRSRDQHIADKLYPVAELYSSPEISDDTNRSSILVHATLASSRLPALQHGKSILSNATKRTRKVGVTGKYGTRYGASLRKQVKKVRIDSMAVGAMVDRA
ncbi:hypothetical protein JVT61DRAFT_4225 [Boletus reticuloceps]|uniref:Uncharacterized protein n=1 Tax=Boletus reticuloceps TaxID=495285 RepID=A0A8I3A9R9_9AGAM|nr:hypothetical protein JVT61DRAFT_4225 [Boletus reticuloceps]